MQVFETQPDRLREILNGVIHSHGHKWVSFARIILGNQADAEDVVQESVRPLLARNRDLLSEDEVRMYLNRVVGNTAIDMYNARKRDRMRRLPLREDKCPSQVSANPHRAFEDLEQSVERERMVALMREGLASLPVKQYEALRMTLLDSAGTSIRDAGVVNGIPYSTLRHRAVQGLRQLRRYIHRSRRSGQLRAVLG
jgi:RNA polymerase sigma factor (sigma-70 family)